MKNYFSVCCYMLLVAIALSSCSGKFDGKNGKRIVYFDGTEKISQSVDYKNGKKNGWWLEFHENGNPKVKSKYVNDTLQDSSFYYYKNGKLSDIQIYKNGKGEGCWKKFNENGMLYSEINFKNSLKEGTCTKYTYLSGRLLERTNYKHGLKDGKQEYYYNNGKPKSVSNYLYNQQTEGLEEWSEAGNKINNDFKITVQEQNRVMLEGKLKYNIFLSNPKPGDVVKEMFESYNHTGMLPGIKYERSGDHFTAEFYVPKHGFVMKTIEIAAFRKTVMGNVMIKRTSFNVSATNF